MMMRGERWHFWLPVGILALFAVHTLQYLVRAHIDPEIEPPDYEFKQTIAARRGSIYAMHGRESPLVKSVPFWEYRLDPVHLTNRLAHTPKRYRRTKEEVLKTISDTLNIDSTKLARMAENTSNTYQYLDCSSDAGVYHTLSDSRQVVGVAICDRQVRQYLNGRMLSHVLGALGGDGEGASGLELKYNRLLKGMSGVVRSKKDGRGRELYDKRTISIPPKDGSDLYLTIEPNLQLEAERTLKWGIGEYGAASGWAIVMDTKTGAIRAMAAYPDFEPTSFSKASDESRMNRAIAYNFEPGSVMKVLTAATALEAFPKKYTSRTVFSSNRDDPNYYKLPGDSHAMAPRMTLEEGIVHSSNVVIGKLAYDLGPLVLYDSFRRFGFGAKTGIDLPGEQVGILPNPRKKKWDDASRSRAGIGQFVSVTPIQLVSAYQSLANDGIRMKPYLVEKIVASDGTEHVNAPEELGRTVSARTARQVRAMMLDVASKHGTARRAAMRGYTIAGKTGTAQKAVNGRYQSGLYRASFCGIVPAGSPRVVVLVTLDFDNYRPLHQGGNTSAVLFKRIALSATRHLDIAPDKPEEILDGKDEYEEILGKNE